MRVFVLALAIIATPAVAAEQQFDLICKGQQRFQPSQRVKPYEVRYRVDLTRMIYCRFECKGTETISAANDARVTFQTSANRPNAPLVIHYVDRASGEWQYYIGGLVDAKGTCEPAPFSGFPAQKF